MHSAQICWQNQNQIDLENYIVINMRARARSRGAGEKSIARLRPLAVGDYKNYEGTLENWDDTLIVIIQIWVGGTKGEN